MTKLNHLKSFNLIQQKLPPTVPHKSVLGNVSDITVALCLLGESLCEWAGACLSTACFLFLQVF